MTRLFLLAALPSILLASCSQNHSLVKDGHSDYRIFVSRKATAPEKYAATELQTFLYKISGCRMEITHDTAHDGKRIYIGFSEAPRSISEDLDSAGFSNEEYIIRSDGENMLIAGGGSRGTLYGVTSYLSDYLGCRWYTRDVEKIPSRSTITLPVMEDRQKPAFEYREVYWREAYDTAWEVHNRQTPSALHIPDSMGGSYVTYPFVHTFYQLVPPGKYFQAHPLYFSEINGKRVGENAQLCLTNPDVANVAISTVFGWIKAHPEANVFSVDQNDGEGYCECANCRKLDAEEGSHAGTLLSFVNRIADTVAKVYPKIKLQTLAYDYTVVPPRHVRPADNVMIRLCHYNYCAAHPIEGCINNKPYLEQLDQWKHIAQAITIWEYYTDFQHYFLPFPNFESFKRDIRFYADRNVKGIFAEGNSGAGGEFAQLKSWVIARLMWSPHQDAQRLIDEFINNVYGNAAAYVAAYIRSLHEQVHPDTHFGIWAKPYEISYLNLANVRRADSLFTLARHAAAGDTALAARIELAYLPVLYTKLYYFSEGGVAYLDKKELPAALSQFGGILRKHHITYIGEDPAAYGNLEKFLGRINLAATSEFYTAWQLIGPFDNKDNKGLQKRYPPEQEYDAARAYAGANGQQVNWKKYDDSTTGYVDLNKALGPSENVVAYARRMLSLPEAEVVKFGLGNNDGARVWVNGKLVFDFADGSVEPNQHTFTAKLNKGENVILIKVSQLKRGWGFYFSKVD